MALYNTSSLYIVYSMEMYMTIKINNRNKPEKINLSDIKGHDSIHILKRKKRKIRRVGKWIRHLLN